MFGRAWVGTWWRLTERELLLLLLCLLLPHLDPGEICLSETPLLLLVWANS